MNLAEAMRRAGVLEWTLQEQLRPHMERLVPRPSVYLPEFIAANQEERADNILAGTKAEQVGQGGSWRGLGASRTGRWPAKRLPGGGMGEGVSGAHLELMLLPLAGFAGLAGLGCLGLREGIGLGGTSAVI